MEFWWMFLGHLVGDYIFQNDKMAQNKSRPGWVGTRACLAHCFEYSFIVCLFMYLPNLLLIHTDYAISLAATLLFFPIAFLSHYPIDRTSFAKWWLKHYNKKLLPMSPASVSEEGIMMYNAGVFFYWFVYVAVDNTLHLILMGIGLGLIFNL